MAETKLPDLPPMPFLSRYMSRTDFMDAARAYAREYGQACFRAGALLVALRVGKFTVSNTRAGRVWIEADGGDGGEFSEDELAELVAAFYSERF